MSPVVLLVGSAADLADTDARLKQLGCTTERVDTGPAGLARLCRRDAPIPAAVVACANLAGIGVSGLTKGLGALPGRGGLPLWVVGTPVPPGSKALPHTFDLPTFLGTPAIATADEAPLLDASLMLKLRQYGHAEFLEFMNLFLDDWRPRLALIESQLTSNDLAALGRTIHGWKGASGSIGATRLHQLLIRCERLAKAQDLAGLHALHTALKNVAQATAEAITCEKDRG